MNKTAKEGLKKATEFLFENKDLRIIMPKLKSYLNGTLGNAEEFNFLFSYRGKVFSFHNPLHFYIIEDLYDEVIHYNSFTDIPEQFFFKFGQHLLDANYFPSAEDVNWETDIDNPSEVKVVGLVVTCRAAREPPFVYGDSEEPSGLKLIARFSPLLSGNTANYLQLPIIDRFACRPDDDKKHSAIIHSTLNRGGGVRKLLNSLFCGVDYNYSDFCDIKLPEQDQSIKISPKAGVINTFISALNHKFPLQYSIVLGINAD